MANLFGGKIEKIHIDENDNIIIEGTDKKIIVLVNGKEKINRDVLESVLEDRELFLHKNMLTKWDEKRDADKIFKEDNSKTLHQENDILKLKIERTLLLETLNGFRKNYNRPIGFNRSSDIQDEDFYHTPRKGSIIGFKSSRDQSVDEEKLEDEGFNDKVFRRVKTDIKLMLKNNDLMSAMGFMEKRIRTESEYYNNFLLLSARMDRLKKDTLLGVLDRNNYNIELNMLTLSCLEFIDILKYRDFRYF